MTNQPFAVPGQRVRWAVAELRKAGIDASVQRGPGGQYYITVEDDDHDWAAGTLAPVMAPPARGSGGQSVADIKDILVPIAAGAVGVYLLITGAWVLGSVFIVGAVVMWLIASAMNAMHGRAVRSRNPWGQRVLFLLGLLFAVGFVALVFGYNTWIAYLAPMIGR